MSAAIERKAEIAKLSRLLGAEPAELEYLEAVSPDGLRALRLGTTDLLFEGDRAMMARLAAGAKVLPAGPVATIAEKVFGPLLCARIAGYVDPAKAVDVAAGLPARFLADVAIEIDPRKARTVIGRIPAEQAAAVAEILTAEDELVAMGRFVGHLEDEAIAACLEVIPDEKLLPIAFVMEEKERLDDVMRLLSDERASRVAAEAARAGHWAEALDLARHVSDEQAARVADVVAAQDEEVLTSLIDAATGAELWDSLLPVSRVMSVEARERFAAVPAIQRPEVLERMIAATLANELWSEMLPMVPSLPESAQRELARIASSTPGVLAAAARAAISHDLWDDLVPLVPLLDPDGRAEIAAEVAARAPTS